VPPASVDAPPVPPDFETAVEAVTLDPTFDYDGPCKTRRPTNPYEV
jgi:hypothetical protein